MSKRIHLFGASGSIGHAALDVLRRYRGHFALATLSVHRRAEELEALIAEFAPERVAITDPETRERWLAAHPARRHLLAPAADPWTSLLEVPADQALNGVLGFAGLEATLAVLERGLDLALANKESLVCGGDFLLARLAAGTSRLLPIDSEHSALFQLLEGRPREQVARVWLTASGGALRDLPAAALDSVTPEQALRHPTWRMGAKITVDSATLVNKGFEVIEAALLFGLPPESIGVLLHPSSTAHALVELTDGSLLCQMARPDMRQPILLALSHPERLPAAFGRLSFQAGLRLDFQPLDGERYPAVDLAREALRLGGTAPLALNAADEVAVAAFLAGRLPFTRIVEMLAAVVAAGPWPPGASLDDLRAADRRARSLAETLIAGGPAPAAPRGER
jgi:1-deoxy-D-xylulose-5-phosphate reductoisomerase